jgi:hypothetical protein
LKRLILIAALTVILLAPALADRQNINPNFFGQGFSVVPYCVTVNVVNRSGGTLNMGDVVVWKLDSITVFGTGSSGGHTMGDSVYKPNATGDSALGSMNGTFCVTYEVHGTPSTDSVYLFGKGKTQTNVTPWQSTGWTNPLACSLVLTAGADSVHRFRGRYTRIDSVRTASTAYDSARVRAYELFAITTTTTASSKNVAGVVKDASIAANAWGKIVVWGYAFVKIAPLKAALPAGTFLETGATAKYARATATAVVGTGFGKTCEATAAGNKNTYVLSFICPAY